MTDVMIDLETLSTRPDAFIASIGAVEFDRFTGKLGQRFYRTINLNEEQPGRHIQPSTVAWWLKQNHDAQVELLGGYHSLQESLEALADFILLLNPCGVWGNGATFDISILDNAYEGKTPWSFWMVRDCRTVEDMASDINVVRDDFPRNGTHHNALDDAIYQAEYISEMMKALRGEA